MSQPHSLDVRARRGQDDGTTVVEAVGELDFTSVDRLRAVLLPLAEQGAIVLDAAQITFCDSVGLQVILEARHVARANDVGFRLAAPSVPLTRVLDLAGATRVLDIFPDVQAALEA